MRWIRGIEYPERCYWLKRSYPAAWARSLSGAQSRAKDGEVVLGMTLARGDWEEDAYASYAGDDARYVDGLYVGVDPAWERLLVRVDDLVVLCIPAECVKGAILVSYLAKES